MITSFGLTFHTAASSRFHFLQVPGFELSIQMSARAIELEKDFAAARLRQIERDAKNVAAFLDPAGRDGGFAVFGRRA